MSPDKYEKMKRQIVPIQIEVSSIDATWKLGQNKPPEATKGALSGLASSDIGSEIETLRKLMEQG